MLVLIKYLLWILSFAYQKLCFVFSNINYYYLLHRIICFLFDLIVFIKIYLKCNYLAYISMKINIQLFEMCIIWIFVWNRVVPRRLSFQPQAKMHPCLLLVLTKMNTSQSLTLFPMLAAQPIALLPLPRFF